MGGEESKPHSSVAEAICGTSTGQNLWVTVIIVHFFRCIFLFDTENSRIVSAPDPLKRRIRGSGKCGTEMRHNSESEL
jgi:hypothetical protein